MNSDNATVIKVSDEELVVDFPIDGVRFEANVVIVNQDNLDDICRAKLASSPGPLISDFVTHPAAFSEFNRQSRPATGRRYPENLKKMVREAVAAGLTGSPWIS